MINVKGFKDSWILTEDGLKKTNLIIKDGVINSLDDEIVDEAGDELIKLDDDKLVIVPENIEYSDDAIEALVEFQERFFNHIIIR